MAVGNNGEGVHDVILGAENGGVGVGDVMTNSGNGWVCVCYECRLGAEC